jgi:hypothetical protein
MHSKRSHARLKAIALTAIVIAGCGKSGPATYPVEGRVVFPDGSPMPGGTIEFESLEGTAPLNARGRIEPDGRFHLVTAPRSKGAVAGKHRVLVRALAKESEPLDGKPARPPQLHPRFEQYGTSGLHVTVEPQPNQFTIEVARP